MVFRMNWKQYTLSGKIFFILSIINLIGIYFGYIRVFTLGENTWYPSVTSFWYDRLLELSFVVIYLSIVITYFGFFIYRKKYGRIINFFTKIGIISLILSGILFNIVFAFGLLD